MNSNNNYNRMNNNNYDIINNNNYDRMGNQTRIFYDNDNEQTKQSTDPLSYMLSNDSIYNYNTCLQINNTGSKISSLYPKNYVPAQSQQLIDNESSLLGITKPLKKYDNVNYLNMQDINMINMTECQNVSNLQTKYDKYNKELINSYSFGVLYNNDRPLFMQTYENTKNTAKDNYNIEDHPIIDMEKINRNCMKK